MTRSTTTRAFSALPSVALLLSLLLWPLLLVGACASSGASFADDGALRAELIERMEVDQAVRKEAMAHRSSGSPMPDDLAERWRAIDTDNTAWIARVLDERGWPPMSAVGPEGATAVFLLVQHADHDPDFQRRALPLLAAAVEAGEARPANLALLTDRVRLKDDLPQVYGSQIQMVDGVPTPFPIEDEEHVDERRAKMGLEPLADYLKRFPGR